MPRIPQAFLDSVIYLYRSREDAERGEQAGGSGFLLGVSAEEDRSRWGRGWGSGGHLASLEVRNGPPWFLCAVTAAHVVRNGMGNSPVIRLNTEAGAMEIAELTESDWTFHSDGDDVTICPLGFSHMYPGWAFVPDNFILTEEALGDSRMRSQMGEGLDIGPGSETFFVGRFLTHEGRQRNAPTVRFGNIAMMPTEPIKNPLSGIEQESFLVEMRSLSGYSGSPVFVYGAHIGTDKWIEDSNWRGDFGWRDPVKHEPLWSVWLLGIDWCHLPSHESVRYRDGRVVDEGWYVQQNSGMMGVVPAWKLAELLSVEDVVAIRKKAEGEWKKAQTEGPAQPDAAGQVYGRQDFLADLREGAKRRERQREKSSRLARDKAEESAQD